MRTSRAWYVSASLRWPRVLGACVRKMIAGEPLANAARIPAAILILMKCAVGAYGFVAHGEEAAVGAAEEGGVPALVGEQHHVAEPRLDRVRRHRRAAAAQRVQEAPGLQLR